MTYIFFNSVGRLRSGWRFVLSLTLFMFLLITLESFFWQLNTEAGLTVFNSPPGFIFSRLIFVVALTVAGWLLSKWFEDLPFRTLGWTFRGHWWRDFLLGSFLGFATLALAAFFAWLSGGLQLITNNTANPATIFYTLLVTIALFIPAAAYEELLARSYPLQTLTRARLGWLGALLTSLLFSALHLGNPNVAPYFTFINTLLAGIWLAVGYLKVRNLWLPLGLHWAWNWAMISFFGLPVSGLTEFGGVRPEPIFRGVDTGPVWLTGGHYGLEGGAAATIAIIISTLIIWFAPIFKADEEIFILTSRENPAQTNKPQPEVALFPTNKNS